MKYRIVDFLTIFLLALVTGVFWGTWFTLTRSLDQFSESEFIHIGQVIIANVAWPMRIILPSCILCLSLAVWFYPIKRSEGFYYSLGALLLMIGTLLITLLVLVPIDNEIRTWTPGTVPSYWEALRARWQTFHAVRTFTTLVSFALFSISLIQHRYHLTKEIYSFRGTYTDRASAHS